MQNAFNKITAYLPHNWVELNGLRRFFLVVFYLTLAIGLYAAVCWVGTFFAPAGDLAAASAPMRRIYGLAALQAALACAGIRLFILGLQVLDDTQKALTK